MNIAQMIDHTCLSPVMKEEDIKRLCDEAIRYQFKTVCVPPCYIGMAAHLLSNTNVGITTVVGFPLGNESAMTKAFQAKEAVLNGASEIDMVINIGALKDEKYDYVQYDIQSVAQAAKETCSSVIVKVIIETCYLTDEEIQKVCEIILNTDADFVKTSTGFGTRGASVKDVELIKAIVQDQKEIKASGGIRDIESAMALLNAGATRLGTSRSVEIIHQAGTNVDTIS